MTTYFLNSRRERALDSPSPEAPRAALTEVAGARDNDDGEPRVDIGAGNPSGKSPRATFYLSNELTPDGGPGDGVGAPRSQPHQWPVRGAGPPCKVLPGVGLAAPAGEAPGGQTDVMPLPDSMGRRRRPVSHAGAVSLMSLLSVPQRDSGSLGRIASPDLPDVHYRNVAADGADSQRAVATLTQSQIVNPDVLPREAGNVTSARDSPQRRDVTPQRRDVTSNTPQRRDVTSQRSDARSHTPQRGDVTSHTPQRRDVTPHTSQCADVTSHSPQDRDVTPQRSKWSSPSESLARIDECGQGRRGEGEAESDPWEAGSGRWGEGEAGSGRWEEGEAAPGRVGRQLSQEEMRQLESVMQQLGLPDRCGADGLAPADSEDSDSSSPSPTHDWVVPPPMSPPRRRQGDFARLPEPGPVLVVRQAAVEEVTAAETRLSEALEALHHVGRQAAAAGPPVPAPRVAHNGHPVSPPPRRTPSLQASWPDCHHHVAPPPLTKVLPDFSKYIYRPDAAPLSPSGSGSASTRGGSDVALQRLAALPRQNGFVEPPCLDKRASLPCVLRSDAALPTAPRRSAFRPIATAPTSPPMAAPDGRNAVSAGAVEAAAFPRDHAPPAPRVVRPEAIAMQPATAAPAFQVKRRQLAVLPPRLSRSLDVIPSDIDDVIDSGASSREPSPVCGGGGGGETTDDGSDVDETTSHAQPLLYAQRRAGFQPIAAGRDPHRRYPQRRHLAGDDASMSSMCSSELSQSDPALNSDSATAYESEYDNYRPGMRSDDDFFCPATANDVDIDLFDDINIENITVGDKYNFAALPFPAAMMQQRKTTEV